MGKCEKKRLVSCFIISYRHKEFISDCFESILAQTYPNIEILYLDDASGDGTFEKACEYKERFLEKFSNVVFIENRINEGVVKNLNNLIRLSKGEYIKFLAADDFLLSDGIEKLVDFMDEYPQHDMVYSNGIKGNEDLHFPIKNEKEYQYIYREIQPSGTTLFDLLYDKDFISAPGVMLRKKIYDEIGLYDERIGIEDWDCFLRIAVAGGSIGYCQGVTVMYRVLDNSLSHSSDLFRRINMKKSELMILEKYKDMAPKSKEKMESSVNEALSDAFHISDNEYIAYLYSYARINKLKISIRNLFKHVLYKFKIVKLFDYFSI